MRLFGCMPDLSILGARQGFSQGAVLPTLQTGNLFVLLMRTWDCFRGQLQPQLVILFALISSPDTINQDVSCYRIVRDNTGNCRSRPYASCLRRVESRPGEPKICEGIAGHFLSLVHPRTRGQPIIFSNGQQSLEHHPRAVQSRFHASSWTAAVAASALPQSACCRCTYIKPD